MLRIVSSAAGTLLLAAVALGQGVAPDPNAAAAAPRGDTSRVGVEQAEARQAEALQLEYGATLALTGDLEGAEAIFSSLLSSSSNAAAAWSNLGNVHLMRGDAEIARDLYDQALDIDPEGWGALLNRSVARMLLNDVEGSREDAARAMSGCGGPEAALALMGIASRQAVRPADEIEHSPLLSEEDVRALLVSALAEVPADTTRAASEAVATDEEGSSRSAWRPAGTRATGGTDLARVLHWQY